jgi:hypothetical protein
MRKYRTRWAATEKKNRCIRPDKKKLLQETENKKIPKQEPPLFANQFRGQNQSVSKTIDKNYSQPFKKKVCRAPMTFPIYQPIPKNRRTQKHTN